ncbi:hypothetical protein [Candidatus Minimicrobia naudis]
MYNKNTTREELLATAEQKYDEVPVLVPASAIDYATEKHAGQKQQKWRTIHQSPAGSGRDLD